MKVKYYVVFGVIVLGLIVGMWRLRSGTSSSPAATVKAFYEALNEGNLSKAEQYISPEKEFETVLILTAKYQKEELELIIHKIQKVEITGTHTEKEPFDGQVTKVVVKVTLNPSVKKKLQSSYKEHMRGRKAAWGQGMAAYDKWADEEHRLSMLIGFIEWFEGKKTWALEEWDGKWKISGSRRY